jgi:hypothetical protein
VTVPSREEYAQWTTAHFDSLAAQLRAQIQRSQNWSSSHVEAIRNPGGTEWTGQSADAAADIADRAIVVTNGRIGTAEDLVKIAERGRDSIRGAMSKLDDAISTAEEEGFEVGSDWSVTPTETWDPDTIAAASDHADTIQYHVKSLVDTDNALSGELTKKGAELDGLKLPRPKGKSAIQLVDNKFKQDTPGDQPKPDPKITGPAAPPQHEQDGYDLQDQFQDGQGPTFGGDPRLVNADGSPAHVPRSPASQLAQCPPGTRPLPTGTAIGPDGHRYAFFSNPDGVPVPGVNEYATNGSVWDYSNPAHPVKVGDLPGVFQASGVYDPATKQMVIVGNTSNKIGDTTRGLWTAPVDPAHPNNWISSLHRVGDVALPGDRESQLIALKGGGYALIGSTNGGPVEAITASTPQGLMGAAPQTLITQEQLRTVYGPTVTGTTVDANGLETIQLRVSTWPPGPIYDPHTWTTTFGVQH